MGPICVREYLSQCPPFSAPAKIGWPVEYITLAPPGIKVPEGTTLRNRLLAESLQHNGNITAFARSLESEVGTVASTSSEQSRAEQVRDSLLSRLSFIFGSWQFNCGEPMCDIFYPQMIDWISLWSLTNKIWGTSTSHSIPFTSEAAIIGYCKCEGPLYDGIMSAQVSNEVRTIILTLILQALLPSFFRAAFACTSERLAEGSDGCQCCECYRCRLRCHRITVAFVLGTVMAMSTGVFLLKFDPEGWRRALFVSAASAALVDPAVSLLQLFLCVRSGWPLRKCGCSAPREQMLEKPWLYRQFIVWQGASGHTPDSAQDLEPARVGRVAV